MGPRSKGWCAQYCCLGLKYSVLSQENKNIMIAVTQQGHKSWQFATINVEYDTTFLVYEVLPIVLVWYGF